MAADSDGDFLRAFFACQYAGLVPAPVPLPAPFGGKDAYVAHLRRMLIASGARAAVAPPALAPWFAQAAEGLAVNAVGALERPAAGAGRRASLAGPRAAFPMSSSLRAARAFRWAWR